MMFPRTAKESMILWKLQWVSLAGVILWLVLPVAAAEQIDWPENLAPARKAMLEKGLAFLEKHPRVPYLHAGADAKGMDCSGAAFFLLQQVGIELPRTSNGQYEWVKKRGTLTTVPATSNDPKDPAFAKLLPGDLIFWAARTADSDAQPKVTHVHIFLGHEKDGHAVMLGSSDGRSYRGKKLDGFGIVDFQVSPAGSATRIVGYGSPFPLPRFQAK
jgi:cell wall-associated NlpC family hydrolase